jgi:hypothetical protein
MDSPPQIALPPILLRLTSVASLLCSLDTSGISLRTRCSAGQLLHETTACLEWSREGSFCLLAEEVEFGRVGLEDTLESHETLDEEWLGVVHVAVLEVSVMPGM